MSTVPVTPIGLRFVDATGARPRHSDDVVELLVGHGRFCWIDVHRWDAEADTFLTGRGCCHQLVLGACRQRNYVPTVHGTTTTSL